MSHLNQGMMGVKCAEVPESMLIACSAARDDGHTCDQTARCPSSVVQRAACSAGSRPCAEDPSIVRIRRNNLLFTAFSNSRLVISADIEFRRSVQLSTAGGRTTYSHHAGF